MRPNMLPRRLIIRKTPILISETLLYSNKHFVRQFPRDRDEEYITRPESLWPDSPCMAHSNTPPSYFFPTHSLSWAEYQEIEKECTIDFSWWCVHIMGIEES